MGSKICDMIRIRKEKETENDEVGTFEMKPHGNNLKRFGICIESFLNAVHGIDSSVTGVTQFVTALVECLLKFSDSVSACYLPQFTLLRGPCRISNYLNTLAETSLLSAPNTYFLQLRLLICFMQFPFASSTFIPLNEHTPWRAQFLKRPHVATTQYIIPFHKTFSIMASPLPCPLSISTIMLQKECNKMKIMKVYNFWKSSLSVLQHLKLLFHNY